VVSDADVVIVVEVVVVAAVAAARMMRRSGESIVSRVLVRLLTSFDARRFS
jgi:hypothetical protein